MTLHPYCNNCGWRKGGVDSWDGNACKCGHREPPIPPETVILTLRKPVSKAGMRVLRTFKDRPYESQTQDRIAANALTMHTAKIIGVLVRDLFLESVGSAHEGPLYKLTDGGRERIKQ